MDRYICRNCGETFDKPREYVERHGLETGPYEHLFCCPYCGGDYEEATACEQCGRVIPLSDACIAEDSDGCDISVCSDCADELAEREAEATEDTDELSMADELARSVEAIYMDPVTLNSRLAPVSGNSQITKVMRPTLDSAVLLDKSPLGALILRTLRRCNPESELTWCLTAYDPTAKTATEMLLDRLVIESVLDTHVIPGHWRPLVARALALYATTQLYDQSHEAEQVLAAASLLDPSVLMAYPTVVCDLSDALGDPDMSETGKLLATDDTLRALNHDLRLAAQQRCSVLIQVGSHSYLLPADAVTAEEAEH